jgi:DNA-binding MarR family transcriptional regulator
MQCRGPPVVYLFVSERIRPGRVRSNGLSPSSRGREAEFPAQPLRQLIRVNGLLRRLSEPHFARFGLSPAQWGVLRALSRLEERGESEPRMHELGAALLVHPPSLSATLDRMERAGLVTKRDDENDRRICRVALTRTGRERLEGARDLHNQWIDRVMSGLGRPEQARLADLLTRLGGHMSNLIAGSPPQSASPATPTRRPRRRRPS